MLKSNGQLTIALLISMIIWGISWPSSGILAQYGTPITLGFFRYFFVIISLFILLKIARIPLSISNKSVAPLIAASGLMAFYNYSFLKGLQIGNPGAGGVLVTTLNPIMAYSLGLIVDWRKPSKNEFIGLFLGAIAGCCLLKLWVNFDLLLNTGNLLFLLSSFLWASMSKFTANSKNYGHPFAFTFWLYTLTCLFLTPFINLTELQRHISCTEFTFWGNVLFGSVIVTSLATTLYFLATSRLGAEKASSFIFTVPFTAALSSYLILGEELKLHTAIGGLIAILAVYIMNKK